MPKIRGEKRRGTKRRHTPPTERTALCGTNLGSLGQMQITPIQWIHSFVSISCSLSLRSPRFFSPVCSRCRSSRVHFDPICTQPRHVLLSRLFLPQAKSLFVPPPLMDMEECGSSWDRVDDGAQMVGGELMCTLSVLPLPHQYPSSYGIVDTHLVMDS